ncbi:MAG: hypothetical protein ACX930_15345 [Erythrobacter sp.]
MSVICPIGTCRINNPLRRARPTHDFALEKSRNYGFTHTAHEALQQLRFMLGEIDIPERSRQVSFRHGRGGELAETMETQPDYYLVEISSAKNITLDGYAVQINYFYRRFEDLFSDAGRRQRFSQLAAGERREGLHEWLEAQPSFMRLSPEGQSQLKDIRIATDTRADVLAALEQIVERVGRDRLVVTSHVDARDARGRHLPPRQQHVRDVIDACAQLEISCYNPTGLMERIGQKDALKKDGHDLTHFTEIFEDALFRDWNAHFFGVEALVESHDIDIPLDDGDSASSFLSSPGFSIARYHRDIKAGRIFEASRGLRAAVRQYPANQMLQLEQARLDYRLGSYASALTLFNERGRDGSLSENDQESWLVCAYEAGDPHEAFELAEQLLADEVETTLIYSTAARAAADIGNVDYAIARWKRLFFQGEAPLEAASEVLDLLDRQPDAAAQKDDWVAQVLERYPEHEDALAVLWRAAIAKRSGERMLYLLGSSGNISCEKALDLAKACCDANFEAIAAKLLTSLAEWDEATGVGTPAAILGGWIDDRVTDWIADGEEALKAGNLAKAAQCINAAAIAGHKKARKPRRELDKILLRLSREAYKDEDYDKVFHIHALARNALVDFRQMNLVAGRSHYAQQNYAEATRYLLEEAARQPFDNRLAWNIARAAIHAEKNSIAVDQLMLIADCEDCPAEEREDARERLPRLVSRVVRDIRALIEQGRFDDARDLIAKTARIEGTQERVEAETRRLASAIRKQIKVLGSDQNDERLALGQRLFELDPEDAFAAKSAAVGAMRLGKFETAVRYFEHMRPLTENKTQVDKNIAKCQAKLARQAA